jgi:hypothetical protein
MLAINYSDGEVNAARTAAKARGEEFILIPEMTPQVLSQAKYEFDLEVLEHRQLDPINMAMIQSSDPKKSKVLEEKRSALITAFNKSHPESSHTHNEIQINAELKSKLIELQKKGVAVDSLVISSHDGGGNFFGSFGNTSKYEIAKLTESIPSLKNTLKSVYMLGCYTATTDQVRDWKTNFPEVSLIAGYDQAAPLRDASKGWNYLHDTMVLEKTLANSKDSKKVENLSKQIRDLNSSRGALAIFPKCDDPKQTKEFYRGKVTGYQIKDFDLKFCEDSRAELAKSNSLYYKYESGDLPLPKDKSNSELRNLYTFYRNHEICSQSMPDYNAIAPEKVFFLLFNENVRANFASFKKDVIQDVIKRVTPESLKVGVSQLQARINELEKKKSSGELSLGEGNNLNRLKSRAAKLDEGFQKGVIQDLNLFGNGMVLKEMPTKDVRALSTRVYDYFGELKGIVDDTTLFKIAEVGSDFNQIVVARQCVPFSWHDSPQGKIQAPDCAAGN